MSSYIPPVSKSIGWISTIQRSKSQMLDLNRQLGTGKVAETYGGLGIDRVVSISMRARISSIDSYLHTAEMMGTRLQIATSVLDRLDAVVGDARSTTLIPGYDLNGGNKSSAQTIARSYLDEFVSQMNTEVAGRYLFGGQNTDTKPVETIAHILDGDGARDGFRQVSLERRLADLGADGRGRLGSSVAASTVSFAEDGAHPFGFKLAGINAIGSSVAVTAPSGSPAAGDISFTAVPAAGEQVSVTLALPDGTETVISLTATNDDPPAKGQFLIGADTDATAANFQATFDGALQTAAAVDLSAASAVRAAYDFFAIDDANPPLRVDGPPFETATAQVAGTPADTVFWYVGDGASGDARATARARVDEQINVEYGMRANEPAFMNVIANLAAFTVETFSTGDPNAEARHAALAKRTSKAFSEGSGVEQVRNVSAQIAAAAATVDATRERLTMERGVAEGVVADIENADTEEVAVKLLQVQNRLQASYQTTAMIAQMSIMDYL